MAPTMDWLLLLAAVFALAFAPSSRAQFPPASSFPTVLKSPINPNITISYKSPDPGTCTTVFSTQKQFSGYINIPPNTLQPIQQNYPINTFFWFFEARQSPETAPLTIWLNGGPGSSSMIGLFQESGPCEVVALADGSYGTQARLWGWDRSSNIIYVDQPTQVGFSYDVLTNWTYNFWNDDYQPVSPAGTPPWAALNGTFGSANVTQTANTTAIAAHAIWHFVQGWLAAFPQYNPGTRPNSTTTGIPVGVNLFAESYGGQYGPTFADFFEEQNAKRTNGQLPINSTLEVKLTSLGIINGLVDELVQMPYYPKFANNNTYGIVALDTVDMFNDLSDFESAGGCKSAIQACRADAANLDLNSDGDSALVNKACATADDTCNRIVSSYFSSGRSVYDIRDKEPQSFPSDAYLEYLNMAVVQKSIGVPVNFTSASSAVFSAFANTGDDIRGGQLAAVADLVNRGIRVALIYGDADYICNWMGGEAVSYAISQLLPTYSATFPTSGYADIVVNSSYIGGAVRQYGNLSFSRIYDSGHLVPAYQPETAFTLFTRIIEGTELSTGEPIDLSTYSSQGPANASFQNSVPAQAPDVCWIRDPATCTSEDMSDALAGVGVVINGVWYSKAADYTPPASTVIAGVPGTFPSTPIPSSTAGSNGKSTSSVAPTGVYVATATPTKTGAAVRLGASFDGRLPPNYLVGALIAIFSVMSVL